MSLENFVDVKQLRNYAWQIEYLGKKLKQAYDELSVYLAQLEALSQSLPGLYKVCSELMDRIEECQRLLQENDDLQRKLKQACINYEEANALLDQIMAGYEDIICEEGRICEEEICEKADVIFHPANVADSNSHLAPEFEPLREGECSSVGAKLKSSCMTEARPCKKEDSIEKRGIKVSDSKLDGELSVKETPSDIPSSTSVVESKQESLLVSSVEFSAVAPKILENDNYSIIHIIMYEESFRNVVDQVIAEAEDHIREYKSGNIEVEHGSRVRVCLYSPDITIEDSEESRLWAGKYLDFTFCIFLPEDYSKKQILFIASVYVNDIIATKLKFIVKCMSACKQKITVSKEDILCAFISYASQDRKRVASIIQGMQKARPDMNVFFDVENLRSGENWEKALYREIERSDVFYLCWSLAAKESKWVENEWRYAISQKGTDWIEPIPIDPPDICPPPEELSGKHFNDRMLFVIQTETEIGRL